MTYIEEFKYKMLIKNSINAENRILFLDVMHKYIANLIESLVGRYSEYIGPTYKL